MDVSTTRIRKPKASLMQMGEEPTSAPLVKPMTDGAVVLKVARLDSERVLRQAGTVISPDVAGWPAHRVAHALRHGHAEFVSEV